MDPWSYYNSRAIAAQSITANAKLSHQAVRQMAHGQPVLGLSLKDLLKLYSHSLNRDFEKWLGFFIF